MIFRPDDHPDRVCPPALALAGDQTHAGRPFTGCTLRPLTSGGSPATACRWFASDPGERHRQLPQPGRPAAITRHIVLVMAALASCAVTAALLKDRTDTQARHPPPPTRLRRKTPGMIPLTVPDIRRLRAAAFQRPHPPGHATHWLNW